MADMFLGSAQGTVDSLLGRLTSVLVDEAQLLDGVRGDVQFIKDEMESMNGFLQHVAEADEEDHQVRAWMKQVAEVAYTSQNSIDLYMQSIGPGRRQPGFLGYLRRLPKLVWTLPTRHRIANQIRELKIRSCEVGERRMRYDVRVPNRDRAKVMKKPGWQAAGSDDANQEEERRRLLHDMEKGTLSYLTTAVELVKCSWYSDLKTILKEIVSKPLPVRLFVRALYVNPNRTEADLRTLCDNLDNSITASSNNARQVVKFCSLTRNCKNCLLYMSIFPEVISFQRKELIRRWAVEGMTAKRGRLSALDEAEHCFDLLVAHGFITPTHRCDKGKAKSYHMDAIILDIITRIAREDHILKYNDIHLLAYQHSVHFDSQQHYSIVNLVKSLPSSSHLGSLTVLDIIGSSAIKDHHVKIICNHAFNLKYLSLWSTNITMLPKQLDKLQSLETLDIRGLNVKSFAKSSLFLPKLKHLLAGYWTRELVVNGNVQSKETFSTVAMPKHIGEMTELQVMSHIAVSGDGSELKYVGYLFQLVKLGVVISGSETSSVLRHLYHATGNLEFLRSLSIQVAETEEENENVNKKEAHPRYPKYLRKLKISGLKNGLLSWVKKLKELTKVTLHMTFITDDDFTILGWLTSLSWLTLHQESCNESTLTFKKDAFQRLEFLDIECSAITSINFDNEACPKLKKLAWFSTREQSLSGIEHLPRLKNLQLTGKCDWESVKQAVFQNINDPRLGRYPSSLGRNPTFSQTSSP